MRWLAYAHPVVMVGILALGLWVLREGLRVRYARLRQRPISAARHLKLAQYFVPLVFLGFGAGIASMAWLRDKPVFDSVHAGLALGALLGFGMASVLGNRLKRGAGSGHLRTTHMLAAGIGLLLALAAGIAGIAILP